MTTVNLDEHPATISNSRRSETARLAVVSPVSLLNEPVRAHVQRDGVQVIGREVLQEKLSLRLVDESV